MTNRRFNDLAVIDDGGVTRPIEGQLGQRARFDLLRLGRKKRGWYGTTPFFCRWIRPKDP